MMFTFAHYWGIDEIGVFVVPVVLAIVGLRWLEKRSPREAAKRREVDSELATEESLDVD
ncbi:MAG: hypothetical protein ACR2NL_11875 [Acidimicrobiia bacterium]